MRKVIAVAVLLGLVVAGTPCLAQDEIGLSVAAKVWYAVFDFDGEESDSTPLIGGTASLDLGEAFWVSIQYLQGEFEFDNPAFRDTEEKDGELVLGFNFEIFDLGVGVRVTEINEVVVYGPVAYVGIGSTFGDSPFGWYGGASIVPIMVTDEGDETDVKHWNIEGGIFFSSAPFTAQVGYRHKSYLEVEDSWTGESLDVSVGGAVAAAGVSF